MKQLIYRIGKMQPYLIMVIYAIIALGVTLQKCIPDDTNNFKIFRASVYHFFDYKNMYLEYPQEHFDVFLYNPVFPILFAPFAYMPFGIAFYLWLMLTLWILYYSFRQLFVERWQIWLAFLITLPDVIVSLQYSQINHALAAFMILIFVKNLERKPIAAGFFTNLALFVKAYPAAAGLFYLLTPRPFEWSQLREWYFWKKFIILGVIFLVFLLLPALFYGFEGLIQLYSEWRWSLSQDYSINYGISVMGVVKVLFNTPKTATPIIQLISFITVLLVFIGLVIKKAPASILREFYLPFIIIWIVIFNQVAESPTFVIANIGMAVWFIHARKTKIEMIIFWLCIIFSVMISSDIFPKDLRHILITEYSIKAIPCFILWVYLLYKMTLFIFSNNKITAKKS